MPTYQYETIPDDGHSEARRFEVRQGFDEPVLKQDPETGFPVRRVISGGLALVTRSENAAQPEGPACGPGNCGCGRFS